MSSRTPLWAVDITALPEQAEALADALGETALAVSIIAPPRTRTAQIEALYNERPARSVLTAQLAVAAMLGKTNAPKFRIREVPKTDWLQKVAGDFPPLKIGRWTVHGSQHRLSVPDRRMALQIDAASAFGTGEHPTTRGCLLMLDGLLKTKGSQPLRMLDMGCGSGILAMAWAKACQGQAIGIDLDADSIRTARENVSINGLRGRVQLNLGRGYASRMVAEHAPYDLIMANIFAVPLSHMARDLRRHLAPEGIAVLSGFLNHQANRVLAAHRMQNLYPIRHLRIGEWSILALQRRTEA